VTYESAIIIFLILSIYNSQNFFCDVETNKGKKKNKQIKGNGEKQTVCFNCAVLPYKLAAGNPAVLYDVSLQAKTVVNLGTEDYVPRSPLGPQNKQLSNQGF